MNMYFILFCLFVTHYAKGQIKGISSDLTTSPLAQLYNGNEEAFQFADFDGDSLLDTCIVVVNKKENSEDSKGLFFKFGNGEQNLIGANSKMIVREIFDINETEEHTIENIPLFHWKTYKISEVINSNNIVLVENRIPSLSEMIDINLKHYYTILNKNSSILLLDFEDVYYILCITVKRKWLFINVGA